jgi:hypothetical protein
VLFSAVFFQLVVCVIFLKVFDYFLRNSEWVDSLWLLKMFKVWNEIALFCLQIGILIRIYAAILQIRVKRWLSGKLALVDLLCPKRMLAQMFP